MTKEELITTLKQAMEQVTELSEENGLRSNYARGFYNGQHMAYHEVLKLLMEHELE